MKGGRGKPLGEDTVEHKIGLYFCTEEDALRSSPGSP